jgi:hypothetical protein
MNISTHEVSAFMARISGTPDLILSSRDFCLSHKFPNIWASINGLNFIPNICVEIRVILGISSTIRNFKA